MSDHNYEPEKIRGAIQDRLYCEPEPLGDAEPPQRAEEIEDGVRVYAPTISKARIFFRIMGSWFNFAVDRDQIEKEPTIAERFVGGGAKKFTAEIDQVGCAHTATTVVFEDGSKVVCRNCSWELL